MKEQNKWLVVTFVGLFIAYLGSMTFEIEGKGVTIGRFFIGPWGPVNVVISAIGLIIAVYGFYKLPKKEPASTVMNVSSVENTPSVKKEKGIRITTFKSYMRCGHCGKVIETTSDICPNCKNRM